MPKREDIDRGKAFDWGRASEDYARYRDIYPEEFYRAIVERGLCVEGQEVLDLGTGTGVLPRNLYRYGARFTGTDIAPEQIAQAERLSREAGMDIRYRASSGEDLDFPAESFHVITACQCFFYMNHDVVVPKIYQLLKEDGAFCELFMAWLPGESAIAARTEELVLKYNPAWTGCNYQRHLPKPPPQAQGLFAVEEATGFDLEVPFTRESWHGRIRACRGVGASSLTPGQIHAFEDEHRAFLETCPEHFSIPHYATLLLLRKLPA